MQAMGTDPVAAPARGRPRGEPAPSQRARILAAARRAFGKRPYGQVTVSQIARDAAVSRAVVYELVGGKEDLLDAVGDQLADEITASISQRLREGQDKLDGVRATDLDRDTLLERLHDLTRDEVIWSVKALTRDPALAAIIALGGRHRGALGDATARARERIEDAIAQLHVTRARQLGMHRDRAAKLIAAGVLAMVERATLRARHEGWAPDAAGALLGEFIASGFLGVEYRGAVDAFEQATAPTGTGAEGGTALTDG